MIIMFNKPDETIKKYKSMYEEKLIKESSLEEFVVTPKNEFIIMKIVKLVSIIILSFCATVGYSQKVAKQEAKKVINPK